MVQLREVSRRHRVLLDRLSRAEELADTLVQDLDQLEQAFESGTGASVKAPPRAGEFDGGWRADGGALRRTAEAGASSLELKQRPDGSANVRIDGGKLFNLPPTLADLLAILVIDSGTSEDEFVGWKTMDEVSILLGKKLGRPVRKHAATQHVYRLRRELFARGGVNPYLLQTNRRRGVRFALRRKSELMTAGDLA